MRRWLRLARTDNKKADGGLAMFGQLLRQKRMETLATLGVKFDTLARLGRVAEEDQAQISHDEFISLQMNRIDYVKLREIEQALDQLNTGHYGICLECDEPISPKRLNAIPWARYCVRCQEEISTRGSEDDPPALDQIEPVAVPEG